MYLREECGTSCETKAGVKKVHFSRLTPTAAVRAHVLVQGITQSLRDLGATLFSWQQHATSRHTADTSQLGKSSTMGGVQRIAAVKEVWNH